MNLRRALKNDWEHERPIIQEQIIYINKLTVFFWVCALITANSMNLQAIIEYLVGRSEADEEVKIHSLMQLLTIQFNPEYPFN